MLVICKKFLVALGIMQTVYASEGLDKIPQDKESLAIQESSSPPFIALYPHRAVYILPFYHSISAPTESNIRNEAKFQFSFKLSLFKKVFSPYGRLYFAYTQTAWFQVYNKQDSRPFRDLDYQPELFYSYERGLKFLGGEIKNISFGYNHTSNGERAARSRTQNRLFVSTNWEHKFAQGVLGVQIGLWAYIGTNNDGFIHDNRDLPKYRGYNDLWLYYKGTRHLMEFYVRPPIALKYYPYFELGWTIRISDNIGLYAQYINGYGDNLYEYNVKSQRVGIGFRLWNKD